MSALEKIIADRFFRVNGSFSQNDCANAPISLRTVFPTICQRKFQIYIKTGHSNKKPSTFPSKPYRSEFPAHIHNGHNNAKLYIFDNAIFRFFDCEKCVCGSAIRRGSLWQYAEWRMTTQCRARIKDDDLLSTIINGFLKERNRTVIWTEHVRFGAVAEFSTMDEDVTRA